MPRVEEMFTTRVNAAQAAREFGEVSMQYGISFDFIALAHLAIAIREGEFWIWSDGSIEVTVHPRGNGPLGRMVTVTNKDVGQPMPMAAMRLTLAILRQVKLYFDEAKCPPELGTDPIAELVARYSE
ncbi:hypothetical protein HGA91_00230 [candidate division WWE3 bacterium]|nr:hypothetical protein [candidate division WWE3 bacterium]